MTDNVPLRLLAGVFALALLSGAARADEPAWPGVGVWQGTLGKQAVTVCFNDASYGAYYYQRHLRALHLEQADAAKPGWSEGGGQGETGRWSFSDIKPQSLTGQWTDPAGNHAAPVALTRIPLAAGSDDAPCGSDAFNAPRESAPKITQGAAQVVDGKHYRIVTARAENMAETSVATIELLEPGATIAAINGEFRKALPQNAAGLKAFYECNRQSLSGFAQEGEYSQRVEPTLWTSRFLVVTTSENDSCGGAHPSFGQTSQIWDLQSGKIVDIVPWFTPDALDPAEHTATDKLQRVILAASAPSDADCKDALETSHAYIIRPAKAGMVFVPDLPHVVQACADDIVVPYGKVQPFLSPAGKAAVQALTQ